MSETNDSPALGRREFLRRVGVAGLAVSVVGAEAIAQVAQKPAVASAPATVPPVAPADSTARTPAAPSEDAQALAGILRRRFPDRLSPEQWEGVTRSLDQRLDSGRRLRAVKLANGDEPDFTFRT